MFDDDVSDEDISAEALAAMFRRSREKDRAALDDFVATERSMRRDDSEGAARDQAVVGMYAAQRQRQLAANEFPKRFDGRQNISFDKYSLS